MGWTNHNAFNWVDYVFSGESDNSFPELCKKILSSTGPLETNELPEGVFGLAHRKEAPKNPSQFTGKVDSLEHLPIPDYEDYFTALNQSGIKDNIKSGILFETSRGCWWGQKNACMFCGVNGGAINYRTKTATKVLEELEYLSEKYNCTNFQAVDNILSIKYFKTLLPMLKIQFAF